MERAMDPEIDPVDEARVDGLLATIRDRGYCVVPSLIGKEKVVRIHAVLEELLLAEKHLHLHRTGHQRVLHLATKHRIFLDLLCHPVALALWRKVLGADMICSAM